MNLFVVKRSQGPRLGPGLNSDDSFLLGISKAVGCIGLRNAANLQFGLIEFLSAQVVLNLGNYLRNRDLHVDRLYKLISFEVCQKELTKV